ncbi:MAG: MarR family transcriptional regulator [Candidatus Dactylopiibacterium sp.]|nr:MarR family transcriptional regulator [Candidatus Dactylopiibacterium sp.]
MSEPEERLGFLLTDIARLMRQAFGRIVRAEAGARALTLAQLRALVQISRHAGLRQVELADRLDVKPITLARVLDSLQTLGLIERRADPHDRRAYRLHLTPQAEPHLQEIRRSGDLLQAAMLQGLNAAQVDALFSALGLLRDNLAQMRLQEPEDFHE